MKELDPRARAEEPDPRLGALRRLPAALRRHRRRRAPLPGVRLTIFLAQPGVARTGDPAGRQGSLRHRRAGDDLRLGDLRRPRAGRGRRPRCCGSRTPATRTSARRTCTSSRTARPPRTRTSATCRTRASRAASPAARAEARRPRVAAGLADAALGTDSAGSIRIPAACCGVVGHKPTHGLVPLDGCWPLAASYDTGGPLAPRRRGLRADAGRARAGTSSRSELESLEELEVGVAWTDLADPLVRERVEAAVARSSHAAGRSSSRSPTVRFSPTSTARWPTSIASSSRRTRICTARTSASRSSAAWRCATPRSSSAAGSAPSTGNAPRRRSSGLDLVLTPTLPIVAPPLHRGAGPGDLDVRQALIRFTYPSRRSAGRRSRSRAARPRTACRRRSRSPAAQERRTRPRRRRACWSQ